MVVASSFERSAGAEVLAAGLFSLLALSCRGAGDDASETDRRDKRARQHRLNQEIKVWGAGQQGCGVKGGGLMSKDERRRCLVEGLGWAIAAFYTGTEGGGVRGNAWHLVRVDSPNHHQEVVDGHR